MSDEVEAAVGPDQISRWFWPALVVGWGLIAFGIHAVYRHPVGLRMPTDLARWVGGGLVGHDALWAPAAVLVGLVTARFLPAWIRVQVRVALALSAMLVLATRPVVGRYGAEAGNPSVDPRNAGAALLVIVAVIWVVALGQAVVREHRRRRPGRVEPARVGPSERLRDDIRTTTGDDR